MRFERLEGRKPRTERIVVNNTAGMKLNNGTGVPQASELDDER